MYGQNSGNEYLFSAIDLDNRQEAVKKRVGASVVKENESGDIIVKLVNLLPVSVRSQVELDGGALIHPSAIKTVLTGDPKDKQAKPVSSGFELSGNNFSYEMPAYSFTVIRIHSTGNR